PAWPRARRRRGGRNPSPRPVRRKWGRRGRPTADEQLMLDVYFEDYRVGTIAPTDDGPAFAYSADWRGLRGAFPVSLTMPLDEAEVAPQIFSPWAANLLPEAGQLTAIGRHLGVAPGDVIGLLEQIGRDTAGALSFGAPGSTSTADWRPIGN